MKRVICKLFGHTYDGVIYIDRQHKSIYTRCPRCLCVTWAMPLFDDFVLEDEKYPGLKFKIE